jgi:hypothetical protein
MYKTCYYIYMAQTSNTPGGITPTPTPQGDNSTPVTGKFAAIQGKCAVCGKTLALGQAGAVGATCAAHAGKTGCYLPAPAGVAQNPAYITLSALCKYGKTLGIAVSTTCNLCGGDKGLQPITNPVYQPYVITVGTQVRKFVSVKAKVALAKLAPAKGK